ncbi:MAG: AAA family ATPase [Pseudomonadota bacterium]
MDFNSIPQELKACEQWLCWKAEPKDNGKIDKIPFNAKTGRKASVSDPSTWTSFEDAVKAFQGSNGRYAGIGFVFSQNDPFCGVDLDHCIVDNRFSGFALKTITRLKSYTEYSPSKSGVHVIGRGKLPGRGRKNGSIEIFDSGKFFTFTGDLVDSTPHSVNDCQEAIEAIYYENFGADEHKEAPTSLPCKPTTEDEKIIALASGAKNGEKFKKLMGGDWSDYLSQSEADLAVASLLSFYTQEVQQIERIMRTSKLYREKWDTKRGDETYVSFTIKRALEDQREHYTYTGGGLEIDDIILNTQTFCSLNLPAKESLLHPWLKERSINLISGWRGVGKTFKALGLLGAISHGEPFGPWKCKKSVPTLFLDGEMSPQDTKERIESLKLNENCLNPIYIYSDAFSNERGIPRAHLANKAWREQMKKILIKRNIGLWVIDNIASLASGLDENKKQDWDPINSWLLDLRFAGVSTILLHHVSKEGSQRGTSAREDSLDVSIILKYPHDYVPEEGARFICHFTKARIPTRDLPLITDTHFQLIEHDGETSWTWGNVKKENKKEILKMIDQGVDGPAICETLRVTKGYVSRVKKQAITDGLLTTKGKLSQSGFIFTCEGGEI